MGGWMDGSNVERRVVAKIYIYKTALGWTYPGRAWKSFDRPES